MKGPPPYDPESITRESLDFSEFHPLDHWPGGLYCRTFYGSWRHHLDLTWQYRRKDQVLKPWHWLLCKLNRHSYAEVWHRVAKEWVSHTSCRYCGKEQA